MRTGQHECSHCVALRRSPWWYRLWLRVAYGIREAQAGLRGPLHLIEEDLNEEWIAETIEDVERRLAAEVAMDEAGQG